MSNTDSFIDEVTEEVRRDRLFALMKRWGWIAVLAVLLLVGGAAVTEWRRAQDRAEAEAFGDAILAALEADAAEARLEGLEAVSAPTPEGEALLAMLRASEQARLDKRAAAAEELRGLAQRDDLALIYRQIAEFKALTLDAEGLDAETRRNGLESLIAPGAPLRLLAEEQLAYLDIETGAPEAALERLRAIQDDAEATAGLRRRASQVIVALGGADDEAPADAAGQDAAAPTTE